MDENNFDLVSRSMPILRAFVKRQTELINVYRNALEQLSTEAASGQVTGIQAALAQIDALQASHQSLKEQISDLHTRLAESASEREHLHQRLVHLAPIATLYDALLAQGRLPSIIGEDPNSSAKALLEFPDLKRQFDDAKVYISSLEEALQHKEAELIDHQRMLAYIHHSISYRLFVRPIWKIRQFLLPDGSGRAKLYFQARQLPRRLRHGYRLPETVTSLQQPQDQAPRPVESPSRVPPPKAWHVSARQKPKKTRPTELNIARGSNIVFTIVSKNYLANARALAESIRAVHPKLPVVTILVDEIDGYFDPSREPFQTLLASDLGIPRWPHFSMKYDIMELNTAVKPYAIQYLMEKFDAKRVIYFDPDILVYSPLDHIFKLLSDHLCVLTPHITSPLNDDLSPSEIDFLKVGTYNLGFFAISQNGDWKGLLRWWQDRLYENCTREVERGLFVDQHWMDLVPSLFASAYVLRDPEYNVAYWNLSHRQLEFSRDGYTVSGRPLCFFHFSGFSVNNPKAVSKHQNRFRFDNLNDATRACYLDYRQRLLHYGFDKTSKYPYAYSHFDNGVPITDILRICLRNWDSKGEIWPDPYVLGSPDCFLAWATTPGTIPPYSILSPYALTLYKARADLISAFPEIQTHVETNFASWFVLQRLPDDIFAPAYTDPVRYALDHGSSEKPVTSKLSLPPRRERLARAIRYFRNYPSQVKPYLPPEAFTEPSVQFTGPTNTYGQTRNALQRAGILRASKRILGMRLVMTAREYFKVAPLMHSSGSASTVDHVPEATYGVTVVGYLRAETGVGQIARNLISCLKAVKFPVAGHVLSVGNVYRQRDESMNELTASANHFVQLFAVNADQATIVHASLGDNYYDSHYNIGYWFWELSDFPEIWKDSFEIYDEIWVATRFVQEAIQAKTSKPVVCIPPAISVDLPEQFSRAQFGLKENEFVVLFIFDALSVVERKNPWAVIRAMEAAFTKDELRSKVRLVIKVTNLDRVPENNRLRSEIAGVNGILIDSYLDRIEVNALISHCDIYISLHRSEGYGLTMAEAMYLGKPVIGTAYSGNIDFMNDENSYLVPYKLVELGKPYPPYEAHNVWAEADVQVAARHLREIYDDPESADARREAAGRFIREYYSLKARGEKVAERLNDIHTKYFNSKADADGYETRH